jgi:hypothetical protein
MPKLKHPRTQKNYFKRHLKQLPDVRMYVLWTGTLR